MNRLNITDNTGHWNFMPVGDDKFVNRWKNLIYNFVDIKTAILDVGDGDAFQPTLAHPYPHFLIKKSKFWKVLKFAIETEIRVKYKHLTKAQRQDKLEKIHNFYINRVVKNTCKL